MTTKSDKLIGGSDREVTLVAPGAGAAWQRIAVVTTSHDLHRVMGALKPLILKQTVLLSGTAETPSEKHPVIVLEAADVNAVAKVKRMVGKIAKVKLLD